MRGYLCRYEGHDLIGVEFAIGDDISFWNFTGLFVRTRDNRGVNDAVIAEQDSQSIERLVAAKLPAASNPEGGGNDE